MSREIKNILSQHKGKENAIASKEISIAKGFPMEDTQAVSRGAIRKAEEEFGLPLISCNKGYYIAQTDEELEEYNRNIQGRIDKMEQRRKMANDNYQEWNK